MQSHAPLKADVSFHWFMIRVIAIMFGAYGLYSFYAAVDARTYMSLSWSLAASGAAAGLWLRKPWSRYPVYLLSAAIMVSSCWSLWSAIQQHTWPYDRISTSVVGFILASLPMFFTACSSIYVYRYFRAQS